MSLSFKIKGLRWSDPLHGLIMPLSCIINGLCWSDPVHFTDPFQLCIVRPDPVFSPVMSRGSYKEIDDRVVSDMAKQCRLSNGKFVDLVDCSLSHEDYDQHLRNIDVITE